jgi:hypothetical protein
MRVQTCLRNADGSRVHPRPAPRTLTATVESQSRRELPSEGVTNCTGVARTASGETRANPQRINVPAGVGLHNGIGAARTQIDRSLWDRSGCARPSYGGKTTCRSSGAAVRGTARARAPSTGIHAARLRAEGQRRRLEGALAVRGSTANVGVLVVVRATLRNHHPSGSRHARAHSVSGSSARRVAR